MDDDGWSSYEGLIALTAADSPNVISADTDEIPSSPVGLKLGGLRLWTATVTEFELDEHDLAMLREACRTVDAIDSLQRRVARDGVMYKSPQGLRAHPALVELRQQRICLARLIAQLGIPAGFAESAPTPVVQQRRTTRGVYGITGVVS